MTLPLQFYNSDEYIISPFCLQSGDFSYECFSVLLINDITGGAADLTGTGRQREKVPG